MKTIEYIPTNYPSDLTDAEWEIIAPFFPLGNKSKWHKRSLINAVFYIDKTGCQWRYLPKDYPPHDTVWSFYRRACESGLWERIMDSLVRKTRVNAGRNESPTYAIIDSQSAKTISASDERGIDGGKKLKVVNGILWLIHLAAFFPSLFTQRISMIQGQVACLRLKRSINTQRLKRFAAMRATAGHLWSMLAGILMMLGLIYQNASSRDLKYSPKDGLLNVRLLGWGIIAVFQRIMNFPSNRG